jgi:hypothetical protein
MTFSFDEARSIVRHYQFLIGAPIAEGISISEIAVVPAARDQYLAFRQAYTRTNDKVLSLIHTLSSAATVRIELFAWHKGCLLVQDFDAFLTSRKIKKEY